MRKTPVKKTKNKEKKTTTKNSLFHNFKRGAVLSSLLKTYLWIAVFVFALYYKKRGIKKKRDYIFHTSTEKCRKMDQMKRSGKSK